MTETSKKQSPLLPASVKSFATGMAHTSKTNFTRKLNVGLPLDPPSPGSEDVLILYSDDRAIPNPLKRQSLPTSALDFIASADDALENCEFLNVVYTHHEPNRKQCVAFVPQYESFHIHRYMRIPEQFDKSNKVDKRYDLRLVPRGMQDNGFASFTPPKPRHTQNSWELLKEYMSAFDDVIAELKPIAEKIAKDNTIVVMVVNHGQSELMLNFACSAHSRGLDTSNILVFATDQESKELAESVGLTAYHDHRNSGRIPLGAAETYGDRKFVAMMMAKVTCVHLINHLGYNLLFQDVDLVWYKNPLEFFNHDPGSAIASFDVYFQDDGSHSTRYSPFAANSGFYFVRYNDRTRYFLTALLMSGDVILKSSSHQQAMTAVLAEHASLYGLKVKVFGRDDDDYGGHFPGGYHYHKRTDYMKRLVRGEEEPYIFHMCWTKSKENKLLFFRQMGLWYLKEQCIAKKPSEIALEDNNFVQTCCATKAIFSCHFNDKPSIKPCNDSPSLDKGKKPSFW